MPLKAGVKPFDHQVKAYNMALRNPAFAFLMDMGTGKSLAAVAVAGRRFLDGQVKRLLIVAPSSVVSVWPNEFQSYAAFRYEIKVLEGTRIKRIASLNEFKNTYFPEALQIAVINYESTWRIEDELLTFQPDMVICDESQRIKTHNAAQSKALHKLGDNAKYKLILTGTPVQNSPLDTFSQWRFLDKNIFGMSYFAFKAHYAVMGGYGNHKVMGYIHKDELIIKAHSIAYRVTKEEALDLPEQIDEKRYCKLEPKAQRVYENIRRENFAELSKGEISTTNVLTRLLRLSQITGGFVADDDGNVDNISKAKLEALSEIIDDVMSAGKKIVIFARFVEEMKAIRVLLEGKDLDYSFIAGEVKISDRGQEVETFQNDPDCKVFLAQIQTAGLGITLTAADTAVFYSLDFNYANYSQARARIHRIGQKFNCTYIHLLVKNSVDEKIMSALAAKKNIAAEIVDNWKFYFD